MPYDCAICVPLLRAKGETLWLAKLAQIVARGDRRWLIRVYLGRDHETKKRNYHNRTIRGSMREAQAYLTKKLRERDLGRDLEGAKITLDEYFDCWLETAVKPRVRQKTCQDYDGILRRYPYPKADDESHRVASALNMPIPMTKDKNLPAPFGHTQRASLQAAAN
jgi:hypothetical protein